MWAEPNAPVDPRAFPARLGAGRTRTELRRRQIVFSQGDPADTVFYLAKGKIELKVLSQQGKEAILATLGAGDFFGEGCLAGQPLRIATAAAATECTVMRIEKSAMVVALRDEPVFAALLRKAPARVLLRLADLGKDEKPEAVIAKISQESLAEMVGTTRSRVSFFMNKFRKLGYVAYNRSTLCVFSSLLNVLLLD
jgi:CRP/FNR family cyclic AMP-dependent transcriptional regulator